MTRPAETYPPSPRQDLAHRRRAHRQHRPAAAAGAPDPLLPDPGHAGRGAVADTRRRLREILHGARRPPAGRDRPLLDPRPGRRDRLCARSCRRKERTLEDELEILMRVYFEKPRTTVGWKGLINDPYLERQLPHQRGPAHRARPAGAHQPGRRAGGLRVPRRDLAAVHRRPRVLGRDRRAHHREPGAPRARLGPFGAGRLQERHRRQREDRGRRAARGAPEAPFPLGAQERPGRRSSRHAATTTATSSCAAGRARTTTPPASQAACEELAKAKLHAAPDDRLLARQRREAVPAPDGRGAATSARSSPPASGASSA